VSHDGTVEGKAVGHLAKPSQCTFAKLQGNQAQNKLADVSGKFEGRQFELQFTFTSVDGATFGVDSLADLPGRGPKIIVPITEPGIAQGETVTTRTLATVVGSGRQNSCDAE